MWKLATLATLSTLIGGCYVGKATFQGEDMRVYPFFGPSAEAKSTRAAAADAELDRAIQERESRD